MPHPPLLGPAKPSGMHNAQMTVGSWFKGAEGDQMFRLLPGIFEMAALRPASEGGPYMGKYKRAQRCCAPTEEKSRRDAGGTKRPPQMVRGESVTRPGGVTRLGRSLVFLLPDELRSEVDEHLAVALADAAEEKAQLMDVAGRLAVEAPVVAIGGLHGLWKRRSFGRRFAVVKKMVERDVQRQSEFFQRGQR